LWCQVAYNVKENHLMADIHIQFTLFFSVLFAFDFYYDWWFS